MATASEPRPGPAGPIHAPPLTARPRHRRDLRPPRFLPTTRAELDALGWDACDVVLVTGDAYVDHPSFGMAVVGRLLEAAGFRVGVIPQPDWHSAAPFTALGRPRLYFGVTAGNMDSMVNRYTADRRLRHDDAYTPGGEGGARPDRASLVYAQRCREAYKDVPVVLGGIEASLRRVAHWDYWSEKVRRSVLFDAKADLLVYGNAERALVELTHRLAAGEPIAHIDDLRGTAVIKRAIPDGWTVLDATSVDTPGPLQPLANPYQTPDQAPDQAPDAAPAAPCVSGAAVPAPDPSLVAFVPRRLRARTALRLCLDQRWFGANR